MRWLGSIFPVTNSPCRVVEVGGTQPVADCRRIVEGKENVYGRGFRLPNLFTEHSTADDELAGGDEAVLERLTDFELVLKRLVQLDDPPRSEIIVSG
jgi:hypothetical protein